MTKVITAIGIILISAWIVPIILFCFFNNLSFYGVM